MNKTSARDGEIPTKTVFPDYLSMHWTKLSDE